MKKYILILFALLISLWIQSHLFLGEFIIYKDSCPIGYYKIAWKNHLEGTYGYNIFDIHTHFVGKIFFFNGRYVFIPVANIPRDRGEELFSAFTQTQSQLVTYESLDDSNESTSLTM